MSKTFKILSEDMAFKIRLGKLNCMFFKFKF